MRTTLNIDDELYRAVKIKAVTEHRTVTELVNAALRRLLDQAGPLDADFASPRSTPPFPTIDTERLESAPVRAPSLAELNALAKDTELESDSERYDEIFGH